MSRRSESEGDVAVGTKTEVIWGHNQERGEPVETGTWLGLRFPLVSNINLPASDQLFVIINKVSYEHSKQCREWTHSTLECTAITKYHDAGGLLHKNCFPLNFVTLNSKFTSIIGALMVPRVLLCPFLVVSSQFWHSLLADMSLQAMLSTSHPSASLRLVHSCKDISLWI